MKPLLSTSLMSRGAGYFFIKRTGEDSFSSEENSRNCGRARRWKENCGGEEDCESREKRF